jgi:lipoate-protein ligase B
MNTETILLDLGLRDYEELWILQKRLVGLRQTRELSDILVLVEHPHTITVGRNYNPKNLLSDDLPIFEIERGGDATYHGPGQLVGYPIVSLTDIDRSIGEFLRDLEEVIIRASRHVGVTARRIKGKTGVWVGGKKLASIGIAVRRWITFHGFALNINTDLDQFGLIRPCGFDASIMTSLKQILGRDVDLKHVKKAVCSEYERVFGSSLVEGEGLFEELSEAASEQPQITAAT